MFPKLRKILLATDGSLYSEGAIREAIHFARQCSARLTVLFVQETNPEYETIGVHYFDLETGDAARHLRAIQARASHEGVQCEAFLHRGDNASTVIVDEAADRSADMIITGRRGRRGLAKLLIGETAAEIISKAPCKVLVVPKAAKIEDGTILVATNGSDHSDAAISEAIGIARCRESRIIALSAMRTPEYLDKARSNVRQVAALAQEEGLLVESLTPVGKSVDVILETASGRAADLIVMGAPGNKGVTGMFRGSTAEKVIGQAGCAVLVVRANKEASTRVQPGEKVLETRQAVIV
jgi:nucleotide-binding universal stress UspA family protein